MRQVIRCVWEHHGEDSLPHAIDYAGAFTRGPNRACAEGKMGEEIASYLNGAMGLPQMHGPWKWCRKKSVTLRIADADSDVLFEEEKAPLSEEEYRQRKALVLKSAEDFWFYISLSRIRMPAVYPAEQLFTARYHGPPGKCTSTQKCKCLLFW